MKNKSSLIQYFLLFLFLSIGIYFLDSAKLTKNVRSFLEYQIFNLAKREVAGEEAELEELKAKSAYTEAKLESLEKENGLLRKQLQAPLPSSFEFIPAKVVSLLDNPQKERRLTIFTAGEGGLENDLPVVLENVFLGKIIKIGGLTAQVILTTDKDSKITAKTTTGVKGLLVGGSDDLTTVYLERILQKENLQVGNIATTSGEDGLPPDLLLGEVVEVIANDQDPFKKAKIKLFVDPGKVSEVFVVKIE